MGTHTNAPTAISVFLTCKHTRMPGLSTELKIHTCNFFMRHLHKHETEHVAFPLTPAPLLFLRWHNNRIYTQARTYRIVPGRPTLPPYIQSLRLSFANTLHCFPINVAL